MTEPFEDPDSPEAHRWTIRDGKAVTGHCAIDTEAMLAELSREAASVVESSPHS
jgi:hypothetical protein